jgi:hypothetical protein
MSEIVERLRRYRAIEAHRAADEIERLRAENERLRKMVKNAYNYGFKEGMREVTSSRGGIPWSDCKYRAALEEEK